MSRWRLENLKEERAQALKRHERALAEYVAADLEYQEALTERLLELNKRLEGENGK